MEADQERQYGDGARHNGSGPSPASSASAPTRADVARLARVSGATVSYVLNNVPDARVSEATKERVRRAAARLGYVPDEMASSLRSGRNDLVLLPFFDWPYNQSSIAFLQDLARQLDGIGYSVVLRFFGLRDKRDLARRIAAFHPAGVIVLSEELSDADMELLRRNGVRAILVYGAPASDSPNAIPVDFSPAGELAGRHLLGKGHRRIVGIVPRDPRIVTIGLQRFEGLRHACEQQGASVERVDLDFSTREAAELVGRWKSEPGPTAIFAYNDEYALLLLSALQDAGLDVPGDVALVGCDDLPLCELTRPRLTSIKSKAPEASRALVMYFDALLQGRATSKPSDVGLSFQLVVRESA